MNNLSVLIYNHARYWSAIFIKMSGIEIENLSHNYVGIKELQKKGELEGNYLGGIIEPLGK